MAIPEDILKRGDVFSTTPYLSLTDAMNRLRMIEERNLQALDGLKSKPHSMNTYVGKAAMFSIEWGVAKERGILNPQCILIAGSAQGVDWTKYLNAGLTPLAHSHPYHDNTVSTSRSIGTVLWNDINGVNNPQNLIARLKVFPSAGDFCFCVLQDLRIHEVKTPYVVLNGQNDAQIAIGDPDVSDLTDGKQEVSDNNNNGPKPRLNFRILGAKEEQPGVYRGDLEALRGGVVFWRKNKVRAAGTGPQGLTWI